MSTNTQNSVIGYSFSENQKNIWQLGKATRAMLFNQLTISLDKPVTSARLHQALEVLSDKHQTLKLTAHQDEEYLNPVQMPNQGAYIDYQEIDLGDQSSVEELSQFMHLHRQSHVNDTLLAVAGKERDMITYLGIRIYTLWADSYSAYYFCRELLKALKDPTAYQVEAIEKVDYVDFSEWQNELLNEPEEEATQFWDTQTFSLDQTILPFAKSNSEIWAPKKEQLYQLEGEQYTALKNFSNRHSIAVERILLAQYIHYLASFSDGPITIGYLAFERDYEELAQTMGLVNKTLPLSFTKFESASLDDVVNSVNKQISLVKNWSDYFSIARQGSATGKNTSRFNYVFEYINLNDNNAPKYLGGNVAGHFHVNDIFEIKVCCVDYGDRLEVDLYYDTYSFKKEAVEVLKAQMANFIGRIHENLPDILPISITEQAIHSKALAGCQVNIPYASVLDMFHEQASFNPDTTAITYMENSLTYQELDEASSQLANYLSSNYAIEKGMPVCLLLERSDWFVISVLGVLKTGAFYVPIDRSNPEERVRFILKDTDCSLLLTDSPFKADDISKVQVLNPASTSKSWVKPNTKKATEIAPEDIAYCVYTSGSTGTPKGCLISHKNLSNYISWANGYYFHDTEEGHWGMVTSVAFDLTITSVFSSLTRGKTLTIEAEKQEVGEMLERCFSHPGIDTLKLTPSHISILESLEVANTHVKRVICGGEQLTRQQVGVLWSINPNMEIYNEYGPTEATVGCVVKKIANNDQKILIGKPIANTSLKILNDKGNPVLVGVIGELVIGGAGIGQGYLGAPNKSAEKFVDKLWNGEGVAYKTGDLVRLLPQGDIEYMGRKDDQVKIRGYRVELDEISKKLLQKDKIQQAITIYEKSEQEYRLISYFVSSENEDTKALSAYLAKSLPEYMIPGAFIQLKAMPLTNNGKVDKNSLPDPNHAQPNEVVNYVAPKSEMEKLVVAIWEEVLKREKVGVNDNFFDIGGHSP